MKRGALIAGAAAVATMFAGTAWAQEAEGMPTSGGMNFQPPATTVMRDIESFHAFLLPIIVAISVFVLALLLWVIIRYNRRANPTPKKFTHNMLVEVIWTIVPVLILVAIAWKSFPLIFKEERIPAAAELTLKVTGNSWFWSYEYPDLGVQVTSNLLPQEDVEAWNRAHPDAPKTYLLATNNAVYVPVHTTVRVLITSNDVIHAWAVPAFGVKEDAIQGRVNDSWFNVDHEGVYYGQCSELCGMNHAFMPIEVHVVSREEFNQWVAANGGTVATAGAPATAAPATPGATQPPAGAAPAAAPAQTPTR